MANPPRIGITVAFDDGSHAASFRPHSATHFLNDANVQAIVRAGGVPLLLPVTSSEVVVDGFIDAIDGLLVSGGGGLASRTHPQTDGLPGLRDFAPTRYDFEALLLQKALQADIPVLGICRGHQMLAEVVGGELLTQIGGPSIAAGPGAGAGAGAGAEARLERGPAGGTETGAVAGARGVAGAVDHNVREAPVGRDPVHGMVVESGTLLHSLVGQHRIGVNSLHRQAVRFVPEPFVISARAEDGVVEAIESRAHRFVLGVQFHPELMGDPVWHRLFQEFVAAGH